MVCILLFATATQTLANSLYGSSTVGEFEQLQSPRELTM